MECIKPNYDYMYSSEHPMIIQEVRKISTSQRHDKARRAQK